MELNENQIEIYDEEGNKYLMEILFTYENEERNSKYAFIYDKDSPEDIIVMKYKDDGSIEEVEVILAFEFKDTKKEYVIYTKNEKDENENVTVYVSNVDRSSGEPKLIGVDDDEEWNRVKDVLRELSKAE